jgi:hypothetical protein
MRIGSTDGKVWLELTRNQAEPHASFAIECSVDVAHGSFRARNSDVHFFNLEEFAKALDAFVLDRTLTPRLEGTYDTRVELSRPRSKNAVMLSFVIGDAYCGYAATVDYRTAGEFEIGAEYLNDVVAAFRELSRDA